MAVLERDRLAPPIYHLYGLKLQRRGLLASTAVANESDETAHALAAFDAMDGLLANSDFLTGDDISVADLSCYAEVAFAGLCELDLSRRPNLLRWSRRIENFPQFADPLEMLAREDMDFE